jgi:hypothetical protein
MLDLFGNAVTCYAHAINRPVLVSELLTADEFRVESGNAENANLNEQEVPSTHYKHRQVYYIDHCSGHADCHKIEMKDKPVVCMYD